MTEESSETKIALLEHRVTQIEEELSAVKGWGLKAGLSIIGAMVLTYWEKVQAAIKAIK